MSTFAENLTTLIHYRKESQASFAKVLGLERQKINNYCKGKFYPKEEFFVKLFELGINLNWIFTGEGEILRKLTISNENVLRVEEKGKDVLIETASSKMDELLKKMTAEEYLEITTR